MAIVFIGFAALIAAVCLIPVVIVQRQIAVGQHRMRTWARTTATIVRVETASRYVSGSAGAGTHQTYLVGVYEYSDPRERRHHGRTRVAGVNLTGGAEVIPILVNPHNWGESMPVPRPVNGCVVASVWMLAIAGVLALLLALLVGIAFVTQ